jgi:hypothetical protein
MHFVFEKFDGKDYWNFVECTDNYRFTPCPLALTALNFRGSLGSKILRLFGGNNTVSLDIPKYGTYVIPSGVAYSPGDWCGDHNHSPNRISLFSYIKSAYLTDLQTGRAFLLLDQSHEGYQTNWLWEWFHYNCEKYSISPKQIIYSTGNLNCKEQYTAWADTNNIIDRILTIPYPHFENMIYETAVNHNKRLEPTSHNIRPLPTINDHIKYKTKYADKIKSFNALQKRPRAHRMWLFKYLHDAGLLIDNIISMNKFELINTHFEGRSFTEAEYINVKDLTPIEPYEYPANQDLKSFATGHGGDYIGLINKQIMLDSWFTIVSEASFGDSEGTCFLSEKTFKPISCYHPFIIFGNRGSLDHLRRMGYKTFSPFINETYDELSTWERFDAIITEVKRISNMSFEEKLSWYKGMKDILEHNYNTLRNNSYETVPVAIQTVKDYVDENNKR